MYPFVDDHLSSDAFAAMEVAPSDGLETITAAFRSWLPAGSTAKWLAVDAGRVPPGAQPSEALEARLAGSLESWSCWVFCTGLGALLASAGHDVRIAVEHHRTASMVDFHSVLVVDGQMLDPYLGPSAPVPPGHDVSRADAWAAWVPGDGPGDRSDHLGIRGGGGTFRYRMVSDRLERPDVAAFCEISATHSGVGRRRNAHWVVGEQLWFVREGDDGVGELRVAEGISPFEQRRRVVARGPYEELRTRIDRPRVDA